ncbi:hypothetical protein C5B42_02050 [Candidatus Cerribacteria bacterium 'Amazon FNV 2010 28 9']|uniref:Glycosyltransferase 2-like domain-containing protein n=1 Tax=Candidatus Cerribacteria bacterium 'Amazon FNV 2010 28 9' TaxID=2081795 RepID=A0A317JUD9_9BACT|nr:MAG: hypothetical protein C5B42_02050 [Candidatus Cerribacteria bacterium 'Amazon FNV 2010 28 9']
MKYTLIVTTKNEENSLQALLESVAKQMILPDEMIFADAGSIDTTRSIIESFDGPFPIQLLSLASTANRSVGRNRAIEASQTEHILITDAGCVLDPRWAKEILNVFEQNKCEVVAGFYASEAQTIFEKCIAPYVLIMPDKLNLDTFLPATRSMGITKNMWSIMGGFDERYRYAEDYTFARKLQALHVSIGVAKDAVVYWRPRPTLQSFTRMIFEHAYGDAVAGNFRGKVCTIYLRYIILFISLLLAFYKIYGRFLFVTLLCLYIAYSIAKNYRYVRHWKAFFYLPILQLSSDDAVMFGTFCGLCTRVAS